MMNPEIKVKWLEALRSGEYKQGKSSLYNRLHDSYCCLGVLLEVNGAEKLDNGSYKDFGSVATPNGYCGVEQKEKNKLMGMNDGEVGVESPLTFVEIANWIEQNL